MKFTSALLISTYNWTESLDLVLRSVIDQTQLPNEILIADDGSCNETQHLIAVYQQQLFIPLKHIWQEDKGFRKSKILNKVIAASTADYIIQVDGDCILHPKFIEDHIKNVEKGIYLYGSRVNILPNFVTTVIENKLIRFNIFSKEIKNKTRSLHIPFLSQLYKYKYCKKSHLSQ